MSEFSPWSLSLGRIYRVPLRVHCLFVAAGVLILVLAGSEQGDEALGYGLLAVGILFASVLAHELGHAFAAVRAGGNCEGIIVGPLGGLAALEVPRDRQAELTVGLAGPAVNLGILLVSLPLLLGAQVDLVPMISLLQPAQLLEGEWWLVALRLTFWINGMLLVANLLPAFPFDGARLLRTVLSSSLDYRAAGHVAVRSSKLTALGICVLAWLESGQQLADIVPTWAPLVLLATWIYCSAQYEGARLDEADWEEDLFHYDFSQGYTSLERNIESPRRSGSSVRRWLQTRSALRERKRQAREQQEERQVDEILMRLHQTGMSGLTGKERALLNRVSARYRNRQSH